jgi:outer membrane protein TolC
MCNYAKKPVFLSVVFISALKILGAQPSDSISFTMTFEDALAKTTTNNQIIRQSDALLEQKKYELKAARAHYFPKVTLNANYAYLSEDITMDLSPVRDAITPLYEALGNYGNFSGVPNPDPGTSGAMPILPDNISTAVVRGELNKGLDAINAADWNQIIQKQQFGVVSAGFVQPIYTGGKIMLANQAAQIRVQEARLQQTDKYGQVYTELVERYFALVLSKKVSEVRQQVFKTIEMHYSDAGKLKEQGIIANSEYLHARVYLSDADRELKKAVRQETIINQALINTLAFDSVENLQPVTGLFYLTSLDPLEYYLMQATDNSPLLKQVDKKIELAQKAYKAEMSEYLPNIAAMGTYDFVNKDLSPYIPEYMVGVGLKWNICEGASRPNKVKAAKYQMKQAEIYSEKAIADIATVIKKQYQELNMGLEQLIELENAMKFADEYYRVTEKAFNEGMATATELADAQLQVAKVRIEQYTTVYQFDVSLSRLFYYAGCPDSFASSYKSSKAIIVTN